MNSNAMFTRCDRFHSVVTAGCYSLSVFHPSLTRRDCLDRRHGWRAFGDIGNTFLLV